MNRFLLPLSAVLLFTFGCAENASTDNSTKDIPAAAAEAPMPASENLQNAIAMYNQAVELLEKMEYVDMDALPPEQKAIEFEKQFAAQDEIMEQFKKALPLAEMALEEDPNNKRTLTMLAGIYFGLNDLERSAEFQSQLSGDEPAAEFHFKKL